MVNFIICDDEKRFAESIEKVIDRVVIPMNQAYKSHVFTSYDAEFMEIMKSDLTLKIYILDIEVNDKSGIDIARQIRKSDTESMIIFCTAYLDQYLQDIIKNKLMYLDFIDKGGDYKGELAHTIEYAIHSISRKNIIRFKCQNIFYTIYVNDILYIRRDKDRKCTIKTTDNEIIVNKTLADLKEQLGNQFEYSHRACIVNINRIYSYNQKSRIIIFDNKEVLNIVSYRFQLKYKELMENAKKDLHLLDFVDKI